MPDADAEARKTCRASEWKVSSFWVAVKKAKLRYYSIESAYVCIYIYV